MKDAIWLKYGWIDSEDDIEAFQEADTLRTEDLEKILKKLKEDSENNQILI